MAISKVELFNLTTNADGVKEHIDESIKVKAYAFYEGANADGEIVKTIGVVSDTGMYVSTPSPYAVEDAVKCEEIFGSLEGLTVKFVKRKSGKGNEFIKMVLVEAD